LNRRALITGGAGFIGTHLARHLIEAGRDVVVIDDLSTGQRHNIESLPADRVTFIQGSAGDVLNDAAAHDALSRINEVFHLAAVVGVLRVVDAPSEMIRVNVQETTAVYAFAAARRCPVLLASSSEANGICGNAPLAEQDPATFGPTSVPRWSYGMTKALDEHIALDHFRQHGVGGVVVRLFNTIGPGQRGRYGMVAPRFARWALQNQPIEVYGDGTQSRTFCDVRDVVRAMVQLMDDPKHHGRVYNLGSDQPVTIDALAEQIIKLTGSTAGKVCVPYQQAYGKNFEEPRARVPSLARIREAIGFSQRYELTQTLQDIVAHERSLLEASTNTSAVPR